MITRFILMILINGIALYGVHYLLGENFVIDPLWGYALIGGVMGILNAIVKPILSLLALPLVIITFGFFLTLINIFLLYCTQIFFSEIFTIGVSFTISGGFMSYLIVAVLLSFLNSILHFFLGKK